MLTSPATGKCPRPGRWLLLLLAGLCWQFSLAQPAVSPDLAGDHRLLERFPESRVIDFNFERDVNYQLVLGNLRRIAGKVEPERAQRLRGQLTRITYEVPQGYNGDDVYQYFLEQARARDYRELFSCNGRACGNSNHWANEVFGDRSLYGPERNQYYLALALGSSAQPEGYAAIYIITRANRRIFAHVEILDSSADGTQPTGDPLVDELREFGSVVVDGLQFDEQDRLINREGIAIINRLLGEAPDLQVYLVVHLGGEEELDRLLDRSRRRAEQLRTELLAQGIDENRVIATGVGPLAPRCAGSDCGERVELVLR